MGRRNAVPCVGGLLLLLASVSAARRLDADEPRGNGLPRDVGPQDDDEWAVSPRVEYQALIHFARGASEQDKQAALKRGHATQLEVVVSNEDGEVVLATIRPPPGLAISTAAAAGAVKRRNGRADPVIVNVQPNYLYSTQEEPLASNDPLFTGGASLWGMLGSGKAWQGATYAPAANQFGSRAARAWANGDLGREGTDVYIGVIDTGVNTAHPDLAANCGNPAEIPGDGIDNDGNGYVDDHFGWNFVDNTSAVYVPAHGDDHGTHVAGTVGAVGGNAAGVVGVAPLVRMLVGKFMGLGGTGSTANAAKAIDYFTQLKRQGVNLVATSNSWGCSCRDPAVEAAIQRANAANILFIAASGNNRANLDKSTALGFPARLATANVISVTALDSAGKLFSAGNVGLTTVDLGAPGVNIVSTLAGNRYGALTGTSMAAPHVSGAAALYAAKFGVYNNAAAIKAAILDSARATPTPSLSRACATGGRLNVARLLGLQE